MALAQALARRRIYYGWYIVGVVFVSGFLGAALNTDAPGFFIKPMTQDLGWSRGFFSTAVYMSTILASPLSMVLWPLVDRGKARPVMLVSGIVLGVGTMTLGLVTERWHFLLIKSLVIPFGTAGMGGMMGTLVLPIWFIKKRGRALAFGAMGLSLAGIITPPVATFLLSTVGWRQAWVILGAFALVLNVVLVSLIMRGRPEEVGLLPDGVQPANQAGSRPAQLPQVEVPWTRSDILRSPTFYLLAFAIPLGFLGFSVVKQHLPAYLTDAEMGFSLRTATLVLMTVSLVSLAIKVPAGFIMEKVPPRYCYAAALLFFGAGMGLLALGGPNRLPMFLGAGLVGAGWGINTPLTGLIFASYFGRTSQGLARGLATPVSAALTGPLGPVLAGIVWDITGTYRNVLMLYMATPVLAIILVLLAHPPKRPGVDERAARNTTPRHTGAA